MGSTGHQRLLTIGEFAIATQLTAKALRLYDEQGLLRPTTIDPSSGYRYYAADQVTKGRFIRALRETNLSLSQIGQALEAPEGLRQLLLREFIAEAEQRFAHERRAYQRALLLMRAGAPRTSIGIEEQRLPARWLAVFPFTSNRRSFFERVAQTRMAALARVEGAQATDIEVACPLLEPISDDDARFELLIPIAASPDALPVQLTIRHVPALRYAAMRTPADALVDGFIACVDALFDWLDRGAFHAVGHPEVVFGAGEEVATTLVRWAFESES